MLRSGTEREGSWRALCAAVAGDAAAWSRLRELAAAACRALAQFEEVSGVSLATRQGAPLGEVLAQRLEAWRQQPGALREWAAYQHAAAQLTTAGLGGLVALCAGRAELTGPVLVASWHRAALLVAAEAHLEATPVLAQFHGQLHHNRVAQFAGFDQAALGVARARMIAKVTERVPRLDGSVSDDGEVGVLLRETKKQRRHKPLRTLFREMPNLLGRLKPCLLMSPLSVAQYLDPEAPKFDLVVFDEASQIPASDAIGALARGNAAIVVGDSKQLPPTRFFADQTTAGDDDAASEDEPAQELESILDECVAAQLPQRYLGWHYRSRHES
ncbi:MAG: hypothetical protein IPL79_05330 [Myxococcales bacterium]|nr:hypothetical protein [Myxococcales bacterium]